MQDDACGPAEQCWVQADEELLLLEAIDMFGLGNWQAVANHIGSKPALACQSHYMYIWVESPSFPAPRIVPQMAGIDPLQVCLWAGDLVSSEVISPMPSFRWCLLALSLMSNKEKACVVRDLTILCRLKQLIAASYMIMSSCR